MVKKLLIHGLSFAFVLLSVISVAEAKSTLLRSCEAGNESDCQQLGVSCIKGDKKFCNEIISSCNNGNGNWNTCRVMFSIACVGGHRDSCRLLCRLYNTACDKATNESDNSGIENAKGSRRGSYSKSKSKVKTKAYKPRKSRNRNPYKKNRQGECSHHGGIGPGGNCRR